MRPNTPKSSGQQIDKVILLTGSVSVKISYLEELRETNLTNFNIDEFELFYFPDYGQDVPRKYENNFEGSTKRFSTRSHTMSSNGVQAGMQSTCQ